MSISPLDETEGRLTQHWLTLAKELQGFMPRSPGFTFSSNSITGGLTTSILRSANSILAPRQMGPVMPAVPLLFTADGVPRYRVGYAEEWEVIKGSRPFRFKAANLTFFMVPPGDATPVQLFRAEWPGFREWTRGMLGHQSPGAGHPHWQFDALHHYLSRDQRHSRLRNALRLLAEPSDEPIDFDPSASAIAVDLATDEEAVDTTWTEIHFASGAKWPLTPWLGDVDQTAPHVVSPTELLNIRGWVRSVILYIRQELLKSAPGCQV